MKLNKLWDGLKRIANGDYVLEGKQMIFRIGNVNIAPTAERK